MRTVALRVLSVIMYGFLATPQRRALRALVLRVMSVPYASLHTALVKRLRVLLNLFSSTSAESDQSETRLNAARLATAAQFLHGMRSELAACKDTSKSAKPLSGIIHGYRGLR